MVHDRDVEHRVVSGIGGTDAPSQVGGVSGVQPPPVGVAAQPAPGAGDHREVEGADMRCADLLED
jgi:hypothetical protein